MAIIERNSLQRKIEIDISGPAGNAFSLMGNAEHLGKQIGMSKLEIADMIEDMQSSDYEHLLKVFDNNFGMVVDLIR